MAALRRKRALLYWHPGELTQLARPWIASQSMGQTVKAAPSMHFSC